MTTNQEFTTFIQELQDIVDNGRTEAATPKDSLDRMRLSAMRQGRKQDAQAIEQFLSIIGKELNFFRQVSRITADSYKPRFASLHNLLKGKPTPNSFDKVNHTINSSRPFACYEGLLLPSEGKGSGHLSGPYFAAIASNFSEAVDLLKGNLVCLFTQAVQHEQSKPKIELRVWGIDSFCENFNGRFFETSSLSVPPESNETILSLHRGPMSDLFKIAVEHMVRASLSKNPPPKIAESWMKLLKDYGGISEAELKTPDPI